MKLKTIHAVAFAYIAVPTLIFSLGMLRPLVGIPVAALVMASVVSAIRRMRRNPLKEDDDAVVRIPTLLVLAVLAVGWCIVCGQFEVCFQTWDWHFRNATLRDLITHSWPVRYPRHSDAAMSFYIGHWLPSALVGRATMFATGALETSWRVASCCLGVWTALGVLLAWLLALARFRARTGWTVTFVISAFVLFSGMGEVLGRTFLTFKNGAGYCSGPWSELFQFTPNTELLAWVFHQTVVPWIATLLLLDGRRSFGHAGLLLALVLLCAPFPAVGLAWILAFLLAAAAHDALEGKSFRRFLMSFATFPNIVGFLVVVPVVAAYLVTNSASGSVGPAWIGVHSVSYFVKRWLLFVVCEVGFYALFLLPGHRRDPLYWAVFTFLAACPLLKIGESCDFCMRASIPALLVVAVMAAGDVVDLGMRRLRGVALFAGLVVASQIPCSFFGRVVGDTVKWRSMGASVVRDSIRTYDRDMGEIPIKNNADRIGVYFTRNMYCENPDDTFFFRCLARRRYAVLESDERK